MIVPAAEAATADAQALAAARLLLSRMGIDPADLTAAPVKLFVTVGPQVTNTLIGEDADGPAGCALWR